MNRRLLLAAVAGALTFAFAPSALAASDPIEHDATLDGTPDEIVSGFFGGDDGDDSNGNALEDRVDNSYEAFRYEIPAGTRAGSFTVHVEWEDPRVDLDVYVYRVRESDGKLVPNNIASSASFGDNDEDATYTPRILGSPVETLGDGDSYLVVVDNWCSNDADDDPSAPGPGDANCPIGDDPPADEDNFTGFVTLNPLEEVNNLPSVTLTGPDTGTTGQRLDYTAQGNDPGGAITNYRFDLNGDGFFETNALTGTAASTAFANPGTYNVAVQATDNAGDTAYASKAVRITGPPGAPTPPALKPLRSFNLGAPVFGGRKGRKLVVRYRLRERSTVTVGLYRGKKRVKRLATGTKRGGRTYKISVKPRKYKRGNYTVRITVRAASGKTQSARLSAKRL